MSSRSRRGCKHLLNFFSFVRFLEARSLSSIISARQTLLCFSSSRSGTDRSAPLHLSPSRLSASKKGLSVTLHRSHEGFSITLHRLPRPARCGAGRKIPSHYITIRRTLRRPQLTATSCGAAALSSAQPRFAAWMRVMMRLCTRQ